MRLLLADGVSHQLPRRVLHLPVLHEEVRGQITEGAARHIMSVVPVIWMFGNRGDRAHGLLQHAFDNKLWPTKLQFAHHTNHTDQSLDGKRAIVVVSGGVQRDYIGEVAAMLDRLEQSLVMVTADEESQFKWETLQKKGREFWWQMPYGERAGHAERLLPIGWADDARVLLRDQMPECPPQKRNWFWNFCGQMQHGIRRQCVEVLGNRVKDGGRLSITPGFHQGYSKSEYLSFMLNSHIAVCPAGTYTTDCFRIWEALEAGCLPVVDKRAPRQLRDYDYWKELLGDNPPFPVVSDWKEFNGIAEAYKKNPVQLQRDTNRAGMWWLQYKRQLVWDLEMSVARLVGKPPQKSIIGVVESDSYEGSTSALHDIILDGKKTMREMTLQIKDDPSLVDLNRRVIWHCNWHSDWFGCLPSYT